jgi:preprotein translocase subunit SecF
MINFLKYRTVTALSSLGLIVAFGGVALYKKQTRGSVYTYSVDFTGGTQVLFAFDNPVDTAQIKQIIADKGWNNASIREFGKNEIMVRVPEFEGDTVGLGERMKAAVQESLPGNAVSILQTESVGAGVGADLRGKSARAILVAMILMLMYIAARFWSFAFAAGAILALVHDAIIMLAIFLFLDREISINFIAAILTVLGYSINDTIVIFSQIREFMKKRKGVPLEQIVNESLNYTLRRTMLTSISTGLPVMVMLLFGGEALRDFSLALLVGIIFGTYSSIYIASPIMMLLQPKK